VESSCEFSIEPSVSMKCWETMQSVSLYSIKWQGCGGYWIGKGAEGSQRAQCTVLCDHLSRENEDTTLCHDKPHFQPRYETGVSRTKQHHFIDLDADKQDTEVSFILFSPSERMS
jgi:hypothetical protein